MEAHPCDQGFGTLTIQDLTFKADNAADLSVQVRFVENADANATAVTFSGGVLEIDLDDVSGGATASNIMVEVANAYPGTAPVRAYVSGDPLATQVAFTTAVSFTDLREEAVPSRVDVGFRCMIDINSGNGIPGSGSPGDYDE